MATVSVSDLRCDRKLINDKTRGTTTFIGELFVFE